jgi:PhnB protein
MWGQVDTPNGFRIMAYDVSASRPWDQDEDPFGVTWVVEVAAQYNAA